MAKVISLFQLRGSIDDLTFRQTEYGTIAGMKPGPTREKVLTHEDFRLTRRNAGEFKLAIQDARLLRKALGIALNGIAGSSLNGRMNGLLYTAARQDRTSDLGERRACQGDIGILTGFDFNKQLPLTTALPVNFTHTLDAATGTLKLALPCFIARKKKNFPAGATHFRIVSGGVAVNFLCPRYHGKRSDIKTSELLPLSRKTPAAICLEHQVDVEAGEVLVQVLGMEFYKVVDRKEVLVKGGALRILEMVRIEDEAMGTSTQPHEAGLHTLPQKRDRLRRSGISRASERERSNEEEEVAIVGNMDSCYDVLSLLPEVVLLE